MCIGGSSRDSDARRRRRQVWRSAGSEVSFEPRAGGAKPPRAPSASSSRGGSGRASLVRGGAVTRRGCPVRRERVFKTRFGRVRGTRRGTWYETPMACSSPM